MTNLFSAEWFIEFSTILILVLTIPLAALMTKKYMKLKNNSFLFWSIGLWLFALGVLLEVVFAFNVYNQGLIKAYLMVVALLVGFLALGSMNLLKSKRVIKAYEAFFIAASIFVAYSLAASFIGNVLTNYVVFGVLPNLVVISSAVLTFPAAIALIWTAALTYRKTSNKKMVSIIVGVIIVSIAGTLYIAHFPAFLYYSEFVGILLLWLGFI